MPDRAIYIAPVAAIVIWSGNTIVARASSSIVEPAAITFYRWLIAAIVLTPLVGSKAWANRSIIRQNLGKLAVLSLLGVVLSQAFEYCAAASASAERMALIFSFTPLLTMVLARIILGTSIGGEAIWGSAIAFAGLCYLVSRGAPVATLSESLSTGDGFMALSAASYAAYTVLLKKWHIPLPSSQSLLVQVWVGVVILAPCLLLVPAIPYTRDVFAILGYAGILTSLVAPYLWLRSVSRFGPFPTTLLINLSPVVTIAMAVPMLNEPLRNSDLIGTAIVVSGLLIAQCAGRYVRRVAI